MRPPRSRRGGKAAGGPLHVRRWEAAGPGAPAAVLVHGMVVSGRYLVPLAERLAPGLRVYVPDLPGHGQSPEAAGVLGAAGLAASLEPWLEAAGLERAAFLGHSFGCQVVAELAVRQPRRVERLVLVSPTGDPTARAPLAMILRWLRNVPREPTLAPVVAADFRRAGTRRTLTEFHELVTHRIEDLLPRIGVPALVVRGGGDPIVPRRWAEEAAGLLPRGGLVTLGSASHAPNWTRPDELAALVGPFLRGG